MKWYTVGRSQGTHFVGFAVSERHSVECGKFCKVLDGGVVVHYQESGAAHNPPPSTERGRRRAERRKK
jgi:hypothetical protein